MWIIAGAVFFVLLVWQGLRMTYDVWLDPRGSVGLREFVPRGILALVLASGSLYIAQVVLVLAGDLTCLVGQYTGMTLWGVWVDVFWLLLDSAQGLYAFLQEEQGWGSSDRLGFVDSILIGIFLFMLSSFILLVLIVILFLFGKVLFELLLRIALLAILIVFAPLAFVLYSSNTTSHWTTKWVSLFLGTTFQQVVVLVVLYIGLKFAKGYFDAAQGDSFGNFVAACLITLAVLFAANNIPRIVNPGSKGIFDGFGSMLMMGARAAVAIGAAAVGFGAGFVGASGSRRGAAGAAEVPRVWFAARRAELLRVALRINSPPGSGGTLAAMLARRGMGPIIRRRVIIPIRRSGITVLIVRPPASFRRGPLVLLLSRLPVRSARIRKPVRWRRLSLRLRSLRRRRRLLSVLCPSLRRLLRRRLRLRLSLPGRLLLPWRLPLLPRRVLPCLPPVLLPLLPPDLLMRPLSWVRAMVPVLWITGLPGRPALRLLCPVSGPLIHLLQVLIRPAFRACFRAVLNVPAVRPAVLGQLQGRALRRLVLSPVVAVRLGAGLPDHGPVAGSDFPVGNLSAAGAFSDFQPAEAPAAGLSAEGSSAVGMQNAAAAGRQRLGLSREPAAPSQQTRWNNLSNLAEARAAVGDPGSMASLRPSPALSGRGSPRGGASGPVGSALRSGAPTGGGTQLSPGVTLVSSTPPGGGAAPSGLRYSYGYWAVGLRWGCSTYRRWPRGQSYLDHGPKRCSDPEHYRASCGPKWQQWAELCRPRPERFNPGSPGLPAGTGVQSGYERPCFRPVDGNWQFVRRCSAWTPVRSNRPAPAAVTSRPGPRRPSRCVRLTRSLDRVLRNI